jgi:hypothetical protein
MADEPVPSAELVPQEIDYQKILNEHRDLESVVAALVESDADTAIKERISSRESKIQSWYGKQDDLPAEKVKDLRKRMMNFVDDLFAKVHLDEARELTSDEAKALMQEFLDSRDFEIVFEARRKATKQMVFNSLTAENIRNNVPEPDNHNGYIEVPEVGKKFCREGTGRTTPFLRVWSLEEILGKEDYNKVMDKVKVPAHTDLVFNEEKLMALCQERPELLEKVRRAIDIGVVKNPRFVIRDI